MIQMNKQRQSRQEGNHNMAFLIFHIKFVCMVWSVKCEVSSPGAHKQLTSVG